MTVSDRERLLEKLPVWIRAGCHEDTHDYFISQAYQIEQLQSQLVEIRKALRQHIANHGARG